MTEHGAPPTLGGFSACSVAEMEQEVEDELAVCWGCVDDAYLKQIIRCEGKRRTCSVCNRRIRNAYTVEQLGKLMEPILREYFSHGEAVKRFGVDDKEWWEQEGDDLSWVVQEVLGQHFDFEDELIGAIVDAEDCWPPDGDEQFFDTTQRFVARRFLPHHYRHQWHCVVKDLKCQRRFFCESARRLFDELFAGVDDLRAWSDEKEAFVRVVRTLPAGFELLRARQVTNRRQLQQILSNPVQHVGPPPPECARAGRMNAEGVVVFYGALEVETALAEMRPPLGGDLVVGRFRTTVPLQLLDLGRLAQIRPSRELSYFQPHFREQMERTAFLRQLHKLIAQPIGPESETEYLITQTLAEYLAHVHDPRFGGLLFGSVQREGGTNIVLFAETPTDAPMNDDTPTFPIEYMADGHRVFRTKAIEYQHHDLHIFEHDGELHVYDAAEDWDEDW